MSDNQDSQKSLMIKAEQAMQQFKVGQLVPEQLECLVRSISNLNDNHEKAPLIEWEAVPRLQNIIKRHRSIILCSDDGAGKTVSLFLAQWLDPEQETLPNPTASVHYFYPPPLNSAEVYKEVWYLLNRPLPGHQYIGERSEGWARVYRCTNCQRRCRLLIGWPDTQEDWETEVATASGEDRCPLIIDQVHNNLSKLRGTIVLRLPAEVDSDLVTILDKLLDHVPLVMLANREQVKILMKRAKFRQLQPRHFPKPPPAFFLELTTSLFRDAGMDTTPITLDALLLLIMVSEENPGKFVNLLSEILEEMLWTGEPLRTVDSEFIVRTIGLTWDEATMVTYAINSYRGKRVAISELSSIIKETFHIEISEETMGKKLKNDFGFKGKRRSDGMWYMIPTNYLSF